MATVYLPCVKCGTFLPFDSEEVRTAELLGEEIAATCGDCNATAPPEPEQTKRYRLQLFVLEVDDLFDENATTAEDPHTPAMLAAMRDLHGVVALDGGLGETCEAANVAEAVNGPLTEWLNRTWERMQAEVAAAELPDRAPKVTSALILP